MSHNHSGMRTYRSLKITCFPQDLPIGDVNGSSDPYLVAIFGENAKFKCARVFCWLGCCKEGHSNGVQLVELGASAAT
jgi:hypothetical protein